MFMSQIEKKSANLSARGACTAKFSFSKNHRDLKNLYFVKKIFETFLIQQRTIDKKKFEIKICLIFCFVPKMGKSVFNLYKKKIISVSVSLQILL